MPPDHVMHGTADQWAALSPCLRYRYGLGRMIDPAVPGRLVFVMLNPSTADHVDDDPTIRKCIGFARRYGFGRIAVVNLFALRSTDPRGLWSDPDPVGPANDEWLRRMTGHAADEVLVAWGSNGDKCRARIAEVMGPVISRAVRCLATTKTGQPAHPLMLPYRCVPMPWEAPRG